MQDERQPLKKHVCQGQVYVSKSKMTFLPPEKSLLKNFLYYWFHTLHTQSLLCFFKELDDGHSPPLKQICSVNFSPAVSSHLYFLNFEGGANRLLWNVGKELPLCAV